MTKTKKVTCSRCKGQGFGTWRVDQGVCFKCNGVGHQVKLSDSDRETVTAFLIKQERALIEKDAKALKSEIALIVESWGSDDEDAVRAEQLLAGKRKAWVAAADITAPRTVAAKVARAALN